MENNTQIKPEIQRLFQLLSNISSQQKDEIKLLESAAKYTSGTGNNPQKNLSETVDEDVRQSILNVFGPKPTEQSSTVSPTPNADMQVDVNYAIGKSILNVFGPKSTTSTVKPNAKANLKSPDDQRLCGLIDARMGVPQNCEIMTQQNENEILETTAKNTLEKDNIRQSNLNTFGAKNPQKQGIVFPEPNTDIQENVNGDIGKAILNVFGPKPTTSTTTIKPNVKAEDKRLCSLIDVRLGVPQNCEEIMTPKKHKHKKGKRRKRPHIHVRLQDDVTPEDDDYDDYEENEENMNPTTEATTIHSEINEQGYEENNLNENDDDET